MAMLGQELGICFGFIALCLLSMGIYAFVWKLGQRRSERKEQLRKQHLTESGLGSGGGVGGDKSKAVEAGGNERGLNQQEEV
ncbi:MAG: hypothetical protein M1825_003247 [Sarcosagium campestre]|nr:MAG: hypothetical protein M1825_003247 [Sarcosagium campestre]